MWGSLRGAQRRWGDVATGQRTLEATGGGRSRKDPSWTPGASRTASLRNCERVHFCSFKPPSLQPLVMAPMGALKGGLPGTRDQSRSKCRQTPTMSQARRAPRGTADGDAWPALGLSIEPPPRLPKELQAPSVNTAPAWSLGQPSVPGEAGASLSTPPTA